MTPLTDSEIAEMESILARDCSDTYKCATLRDAASRLLEMAKEANRLRATVEILGKLIADEIGPERLLELGWKIEPRALASTLPDAAGGKGD